MRAIAPVWRCARGRLPGRRTWKTDLVAGIPGAIASVPDGMAAGVLAGVSPVHGLYASMAGPLFGGLQTSTKLMVITTTSASALAAGSALSSIPTDDKPAALALLTLVTGAIMVAAAALRLGRYTHFVSNSVMTGFLSGIALNIAFGQLSDLVGSPAHGASAVAEAVDVLVHPRDIDLPSLATGVLALVILLTFGRFRRLSLVSALIGLVATTTLVLGFGLESVARVSDVGTIPAGMVVPHLPDLSYLSPSLLASAAAVAVLLLVQGAGVAESAPNADADRSNVDQDFSAQGVGNLASGLFAGMPVGGSLGQTAVNVSAGGRSRWSAVFSGLWMIAILVVFAGVVGYVPMPTLAAVLIAAALGSLRPSRVGIVWRSGATSRIALVATFVATLVFPVTAAIGIGIIVSLLLQLNQEAVDLRVVRLTVDDGRLIEVPAPVHLEDDQIVILDVYGSLFYAGARTLQAHLPDPTGTRAPAVILRLRGRTTFGATFFNVVREYALQLEEVGGRLYVSGLAPEARDFWNDRKLAGQGIVLEAFAATPTLGESTLAAYAEARVRIHRRES